MKQNKKLMSTLQKYFSFNLLFKLQFFVVDFMDGFAVNMQDY